MINNSNIPNLTNRVLYSLPVNLLDSGSLSWNITKHGLLRNFELSYLPLCQLCKSRCRLIATGNRTTDTMLCTNFAWIYRGRLPHSRYGLKRRSCIQTHGYSALGYRNQATRRGYQMIIGEYQIGVSLSLDLTSGVYPPRHPEFPTVGHDLLL